MKLNILLKKLQSKCREQWLSPECVEPFSAVPPSFFNLTIVNLDKKITELTYHEIRKELTPSTDMARWFQNCELEGMEPHKAFISYAYMQLIMCDLEV